MDALERAEEARERNAGLMYEASLLGPQEPAETLILASYHLRIIGPEGWPSFPDPRGTIRAALRETEENVSDLLPEGYYCKIEEDRNE
jgi:hypothetical protein